MKSLMQTINHAVRQMDIIMPCINLVMDETTATLLMGVDDRTKERRGERQLLFRSLWGRYEELEAISTDLVRLSESLRKIKINGTRAMVNYADGWFNTSLPPSIMQWLGKDRFGEMPTEGTKRAAL